MPAGNGSGEVGSVLVLSEGDLGAEAKDGAAGGQEKRFDVAAVFIVVNFRKLFPDNAVFDFFDCPF